MGIAKRILALDIGSAGLKMAEFVPLRSGGIELVSFSVASLGLDPHSDSSRGAVITATIQEMLREDGIRPGPVLVSVSGQSVFSRFVKLPPVDREKIHQIILYEAQQNVPFPMDEVVWDYQLIGGIEGEVDVMLAAIKAEIIEEITDSVKASGLSADLVDVAPMTLYNCQRYNYEREEDEACTLVVDIGARSTDLIFMEQNRVFIRSVPVAGNTITQQVMKEFELEFSDAEDLKVAHAFVSFGPAFEAHSNQVADRVSKCVRTVMTRMHAEIARSINFYRSQQSGRAPSQVLLTGGSSIIPHTDTFLKEKLKTPVEYLNPFQNVAVSEDISTEEIGKHAHELGEVVGLGLRRVLTCPIEIDLLPPKVVSERNLRKKIPMFLAAGVCLLLALGLWCGFLWKSNSLTQAKLARVGERVAVLSEVEARLKSEEVALAQSEKKMDALAAAIDRRSFWLRALDEIRKCVPDGVWISSLRLKEGAAEDSEGTLEEVLMADSLLRPGRIVSIELSGSGYKDKISRDSLIEFEEKLRESDFFTSESKVDWQSTPGVNEFTRDFRMSVILATPFEP